MGTMFGGGGGGGGGGGSAPAPTVVAAPAPGTLTQTILTPGTNDSRAPIIPGETDEQRRQRLAAQSNNILGGNDVSYAAPDWSPNNGGADGSSGL